MCLSNHNLQTTYFLVSQENGENGARYLDPKYSRWISTDPALGEYVPSACKGNASDAGNLPGMGGIYNSVNGNLYHYAGNNPIRYVDPDGRFAGDPFNSPEEAAKDWAKTYADDSIHDDREYASVIYSYETDEGTKFSYNIPLQGERKKSIANMKLEKGQRFVSKIHSHGSFDPNHLDDIPSDADYDSMYKDKSNYCNSHIGKEYLVTPDGNLKSFDIYGNVITINSDLPVDPKSIFYSSHNNSYINPQMYHLYNEYVDAQTTTSWDSIYYRKDSYIPYNPGLF